ncbi:MAG: hypothetical protein M9904_03435 [Chitinophagaceae bacterium]|nr:hypothetical protein [Chitinophagaceae bacterium]
MTRHLIIFYLLVSIAMALLTPAACFAREPNDSTLLPDIAPPIADTTDSLANDLLYKEDEDMDQDTLLFSQKANPSSLYDSSVIRNLYVPNGAIQDQQSDKSFWYANEEKQVQKKNTNQLSFRDKIWYNLLSLLQSPVFIRLIWIFVLILFFVTIVWFLLQNKMSLFSRRKDTSLPAQQEEIEVENIFTVNLQAASNQAAAEGNYRLAIRFSYLHLLKIFSLHNLISYSASTTNNEYLASLYTQPYYRDFFQVMRSYEYTWYGNLPVSREQYESIREMFSLLYQKSGLPA